ncbi:MAG: EAL domain-containing protein [Devosiaceae bacterium]
MILAIQTTKASWNERQLNELIENVILRGEFAIDNVILAEVDLISAGHVECTAETVVAMREAIYQHSALVDIHLRGPDSTCQAFDEFGLDQSVIFAAKDGALAARNADFRFMHLADEASSGLGVVWEFQPDYLMTAVIRTDGLLFDMLPPDIRDHADIVVSLNEGAAVARYDAPVAHPNSISGQAADMLVYSANSQRYPLSAQLSLPQAAFDAWQETSSPLYWFATLGSSSILGLLIALGFVRAPSERELLEAAIRSGEIMPYFQPIVSLSTNAVVGCEVLARWIKPDGTHLPPNVFIPLAEITGLSDEITRSLMQQTGRDIGQAIAGRSDFKVSFNITVKQLTQRNFAADLIAHSKGCGLSNEHLVVELIEREAMDSMGEAQAALATLQTQGVRLAIDDVGTGQNGLALLQSLDADIIKIDKLFVDMINQDDSSKVISEMLVRLAKSSNMSLVAEGVEHEEQAVTLAMMGIDEAQGYYFARPLPATDFLAFLTAEGAKDLDSTLALDPTQKRQAA